VAVARGEKRKLRQCSNDHHFGATSGAWERSSHGKLRARSRVH
jgi:hypothetical protein